jgi:phosphohistidine phosphatase
MHHELLILRHAKSAWNSDAPTDFERPLSRRGRNNAPRVGRFLAEQGLRPDYVVSSPAERARQTVLAACAPFGIGADDISWDRRIYAATTGELLDVLNECPESAMRVLIAGHNPGLESLVRVLCREPVPTPPDFKLMPTAALAHLLIPVAWKEIDGGVAELLSLTRVKSLPD